MQRVDADELVIANCQGNLIRGYNMAFVRHLVVRVGNQAEARQFLLDVTDESNDGPSITTGASWERQAQPPVDTGSDGRDWKDPHPPEVETWDGKPATCLNVGISATGLLALGLNQASYDTFPEEFRQGAAKRATKVGDVDGSDPTLWRDGFDDEDNVHLMWTVHSGTKANLERACADLASRWNTSGAFALQAQLDGAKLPDKVTGEPSHHVHFGYRDGISQPRFQLRRNGDGRHDFDNVALSGPVLEFAGIRDRQPPVPLGALLQSPDRATSFDEVRWQVPALVVDRVSDPDLSRYGCYNAFRVMEQDVHAFESFLESEAKELNWNKEYLAAKLMGRWRNGVPIVQTTDHKRWSCADLEKMPELSSPNDFDYTSDLDLDTTGADADTAVHDPDGTSCPIGSHIRRSNPRRARIVQRSANHSRQLVRRGMPYGPPFDPDNPNDGKKRGLLGSFFCGSLVAQFESMMYDWINIGLQDPRITGTNCPIIGANDETSSRFDIPLDPDPDNPDQPDHVTIRGFPRFVETVGAAYLFYPGIPGLRLLGAMG